MEQELIQTERLAVIGRLAAGVAHEINNPLGIVRTNADIVRNLSEHPVVLERLEVLRRNVDRAADITRKLLRLALPQTMETKALDLAELARECLSFLSPRLARIELNLDDLASPLPILGDRTQLEQIIINLLINALESMNFKGKLWISGTLESGPDGTKRGCPARAGQRYGNCAGRTGTDFRSVSTPRAAAKVSASACLSPAALPNSTAERSVRNPRRKEGRS